MDEQIRQVKLETLRQEIQKGIDELNRGEGLPLDIEAIKKEARVRKERKEKSLLQDRD